MALISNSTEFIPRSKVILTSQLPRNIDVISYIYHLKDKNPRLPISSHYNHVMKILQDIWKPSSIVIKANSSIKCQISALQKKITTYLKHRNVKYFEEINFLDLFDIASPTKQQSNVANTFLNDQKKERKLTVTDVDILLSVELKNAERDAMSIDIVAMPQSSTTFFSADNQWSDIDHLQTQPFSHILYDEY